MQSGAERYLGFALFHSLNRLVRGKIPQSMQNRAATALLELCGRAGRALPDVRGRGRIGRALSSLLMRAGADRIVQGRMARGHLMRLDCRVPSHCWAFFSGRYDDSKIAVLLSLLRPGGIALDVGANIGFYTVPLAIHAKAIGSKVVAFEPLESNAALLRLNLGLNNCLDVVQVIESGLGNESALAKVVLTDDFLAGGAVGNATIMSDALYQERYAQFARTEVKVDTLDRSWHGEGRIDVVKVDVEGNETQVLDGGRNTIAAHRPVLLIEVNRVHQAVRGINFDEAVPFLLPECYFFAELRASGIVQIHNLSECIDTDILALPEERRQEI
jgi:FkbM family methyltransferase